MSGYERPTDRGSSEVKVSFWAMLWRQTRDAPTPYGISIHGYADTSPGFPTQGDLMAWVRANRQDGDELRMWRRESRQSGWDDFALVSHDEDIKPDPARLRALVTSLKDDLDRKKKQRDRPARVAVPYQPPPLPASQVRF